MTDTNKAPAAVDALDQAAADAVADQDTSDQAAADQDGIVETKDEQDVIAESDLPKDHEERSNFGRKVSALFRKTDDLDEKFDRVLGLLEEQALGKTQDYETYEDPDEPLTASKLSQILDAREKQKETMTMRAKEQYNNTYLSTLKKMSSALDESEADGVLGELQNLRYEPTDNPVLDAKDNLYRAHVAYLKKTKTTKTNPLKGTDKKLGVITSQKVVSKDATLPKLDAAGKSYLAFVASEDGGEKATELHKSLKE